jgi:hypothetical protein
MRITTRGTLERGIIAAVCLVGTLTSSTGGTAGSDLTPGHVAISERTICGQLEDRKILDVEPGADGEIWVLSATRLACPSHLRSFSITVLSGDPSACETVVEWEYRIALTGATLSVKANVAHVCVTGNRGCDNVPDRDCIEYSSDIIGLKGDTKKVIRTAPQTVHWRIAVNGSVGELERLRRSFGEGCHMTLLGEESVLMGLAGNLEQGRIIPRHRPRWGFLGLWQIDGSNPAKRKMLSLQASRGGDRPLVSAPKVVALESLQGAVWWHEYSHVGQGETCVGVVDETLAFHAPPVCYEAFDPHVAVKLLRSGDDTAGFVQVRLGPNREEWVLEGLLVPAGSLPRIPGRKDASGWVRDLPRQVFLGVSEDKLLFGSVAGECSEADCTMSLGADFDAAR